MKILNAKQIRLTDAYTIKNEPIKSIDLMERAASQCCRWLRKKYNKKRTFRIFCGLGNNGGDGLAIARMLSDGKHKVEVYIMRYSEKCSQDFSTNEIRLKEILGVKVEDVRKSTVLPKIKEKDIVIDALWGSGLTRPIKGFPSKIISHINSSKATVVSIDIPSGLYCDSRNTSKNKIEADHTLSFQLPKLAFMLPENNTHVGKWEVLPIGLDDSFIAKQKTYNNFFTREDAKKMIKKRSKFDHKGKFGHALLISGSYGKMGATLLAARACMRAGAGLLTVHAPACGYEILQTGIAEAMVSADTDDNCISGIPNVKNYDAVGIGPGIGLGAKTQQALKSLIDNCKKPLLIDADAINILGLNKGWLKKLPKDSILTPHPKEFERIAGKVKNDYDRLELLRKTAGKYKLCIALKGAHTAIAFPDGTCYFNSTGNPGMATAGSGDVLTGIILGLLAQGYKAGDASKLGVYIHGLAGDLAERKRSQVGLIAGDITEKLGKAFKILSK
ncbi:NAD(P)H-hydrate dehydratase [Candidatus Amoebophilus asiaticus]|nr:NAD(P)H-hydrate dehydratase [Candidatus Amoebophilus asiaticus]